jgi:hypothetical protein
MIVSKPLLNGTAVLIAPSSMRAILFKTLNDFKKIYFTFKLKEHTWTITVIQVGITKCIFHIIIIIIIEYRC